MEKKKKFVLALCNQRKTFSNKKKKAEEEVDVELPFEIIENILSRLPVKPLLNFKCVSKSWCSLISSHEFAKMQIRLHAAPREKLIIWLADSSFCGNLETSDRQVKVKKIDYLGAINLSKSYSIAYIKSANGLCCLCAYSASLGSIELFIFNPSIRVSKKIPIPLLDFSVGENIRYPFLSFGYSSTLDDYKIVILCNKDGYNDPEGSYKGVYQNKVHVYSLKNNSWRSVEDITCCRISTNHEVIVNEAIHWIFYDAKSKGLLRSFDLVEEKFSEISLPNRDGFLGLYDKKTLRFFSDNDNDGYVTWVLNEYGRAETESWAKIETKISSRHPLSYIGFYSDDEMVSIVSGWKILIFNRRTGREKCIGISGLSEKPLMKVYSVEETYRAMEFLQVGFILVAENELYEAKHLIRGGCICGESLISPIQYGVEEQGRY